MLKPKLLKRKLKANMDWYFTAEKAEELNIIDFVL